MFLISRKKDQYHNPLDIFASQRFSFCIHGYIRVINKMACACGKNAFYVGVDCLLEQKGHEMYTPTLWITTTKVDLHKVGWCLHKVRCIIDD